MNIIAHNPYRYLGVYSNSPTKERVANKGKMKAFLKVGKNVSFPLDLPVLFSAIERSVETVEKAEAQLALPIDQIRYAQFWWMKVSALDTMAFNHLQQGNTDMAEAIWKKKNTVSSLQNRFVLSAHKQNWAEAVACAEELYSDHADDFVSQVAGEGMTMDIPLWKMLLDSLVDAGVDMLSLVDSFTLQEWRDYVEGKTVTPLIEVLSQAVETAKSARKGTPEECYQAGKKLITETREPLQKLANALTDSDLRYQTIADKIGLAILQCGIDYYNGSPGTSAARPAMELQRYALQIVKGKMAKDRCQENVDILQKIINELPPEVVQKDSDAVQEALRLFCTQPDKICYAKTLLETARPHLQAIRSKLGATNAFYLKLSTRVVGNALHNVIEEVNAVQKDDSLERPLNRTNQILKLLAVKNVFEKAWEVTLIMDTFDMEQGFKRQRYDANRSILKNLCEQLGVNTGTRAASIPQRKNAPQLSVQPDANKLPKKKENNGCLILILCWLLLGCVIGAMLHMCGKVFGIGFVISAFIVLVFQDSIIENT